MSKKTITILLAIILIVSLGIVYNSSYTNKKINIKKGATTPQQIKNYQHNIIDILLKDTDEIIRDVNSERWKIFNDDDIAVTFKYPENLKIVDVGDTSKEEEDEALENIKKETGLNVQMDAINIDFYNNFDKKLGFLQVISFSPYGEYEILKKEGEDSLKATRTWKINRRKDDRVHPKEYESVGYVRSGNNIFPWTVVDAGYKDVFSMSDILWYDRGNDRFVGVEIRIFNYDDEAQDMLYGILKTLKFIN